MSRKNAKWERERIAYSDNDSRYKEVIEALQKNFEMRLSIGSNFSGIIVVFILGLFSSYLITSIPNVYNNAVTTGITLIGYLIKCFGFIISGNLETIILGVIEILLIGIFLIILIISIWCVSKVMNHPRVQEKISIFLGVKSIIEGLNVRDQLLIAKLYPKKWDILISVNTVEKTIQFEGIVPHESKNLSTDMGQHKKST